MHMVENNLRERGISPPHPPTTAQQAPVGGEGVSSGESLTAISTGESELARDYHTKKHGSSNRA